MRLYIAILIIVMLQACSFKVGIDWNGKTGKDDRVVSPSMYKQTNGDRY